MKSPCQHFNEWIDASGLKLKHVAAQLGVNYPNLSMMKTGKRNPGLELRRKIEVLTEGKVRADGFWNAKS